MNLNSKNFEFILKFMDNIKVNNKLSDYGVKKNHLDTFIKNISGNLENDPIKNLSKGLIKKIYFNSI